MPLPGQTCHNRYCMGACSSSNGLCTRDRENGAHRRANFGTLLPRRALDEATHVLAQGGMIDQPFQDAVAVREFPAECIDGFGQTVEMGAAQEEPLVSEHPCTANARAGL